MSAVTKTRLLALLAVCLNVAGNATLGAGMRETGATFSAAGYERAFTHVLVVAGVAVLALWFLTQLALFSRADLSFVLPVTSFAYVLLAVVAHFFLGEDVSALRWVGISLIFFGVLIVGATKPKTVSTAGRLEALE